MAQKPSIPQGTRDFGPLVVQRRRYILKNIETVFKKYGYMPLETPSMEQLSTLTGKYGDEGDQLLFKILNSGDYLKKLIEHQVKGMNHDEMDKTYLPSVDGKVSSLDSKISLSFIAEKGLRYDLTVPFARYVVMNRNEITLPFKRYQMQPVWRADRPQKGRYREFWQCDADVVGSNSLLNEAELLMIYDEVFTALKLPVSIRLNNRKLLSALATSLQAPELLNKITIAIDKLDKIGEDGVLKELEQNGLSQSQVQAVHTYLNANLGNDILQADDFAVYATEEGALGRKELQEVMNYLQLMQPQNEVTIDLTLARGLSYYTGAIVEVQANAGSLKSSIGGGGRYDNLTGIFGMPGISGVGISFGLDRIYDILDELKLFPADLRGNDTHILFCHMDEESRLYSLELCNGLRKAGIAAEVYPDITKKVGKQLEYANKHGIAWACISGADEVNARICNVKNLHSGEQHQVSPENLGTFIQL